MFLFYSFVNSLSIVYTVYLFYLNFCLIIMQITFFLLKLKIYKYIILAKKTKRFQSMGENDE